MQVRSLSGSTTFRDTFGDISAGASRWRLWLNLAWHDLRVRYRRTWLGLWWVALSFALFAGVKIVIFGPLASRPIGEYAASLALGFLVFRFIANSITGGSSVFVGAQKWIHSEPLPLSLHVFKLTAMNLMVLGFASMAAFAICLGFGVYHAAVLPAIPAALLVYAINGLWVSVLIGALCARHRDVLHLVGTIVQVSYFATPILWIPPETGFRAKVALYNPLTHYIAILREPMLDGTVPALSWMIVGGVTVSGLVVTLLVFRFVRQRIIFWI